MKMISFRLGKKRKGKSKMKKILGKLLSALLVVFICTQILLPIIGINNGVQARSYQRSMVATKDDIEKSLKPEFGE